MLKGGVAYNLTDGVAASASIVEAGFKNDHINGSVALGNATLNAYYGKEKVVGATASILKFDVKKSFSIKGMEVELGADFSIASVGGERMFKQIKYTLIAFSFIGISYTTYGTFFDDNNYSLEQKIIRTFIFILFFILGPLTFYTLIRFIENKF